MSDRKKEAKMIRDREVLAKKFPSTINRATAVGALGVSPENYDKIQLVKHKIEYFKEMVANYDTWPEIKQEYDIKEVMKILDLNQSDLREIWREEIKKADKEQKVMNKEYALKTAIDNSDINEELFNMVVVGEGDEAKVVRKVSIDKTRDFLMGRHHFKTIFGSKGETVFVFDEGLYVKRGAEIIQTESEKNLMSYCKNSIVKEVEGKIKRSSAIEYQEFSEIPLELICLDNGILNLKTKKLQPFNPEYYFKTRIPMAYDKNATCKNFEKFIRDTLYEADIPLMQEWFGFCLYRQYLIKKAMILVGAADTGKTTLIRLLINMLGSENVCGMSLQDISGSNRVAIAELEGKQLNAYDDLSADDVNDGGGLKIATGGGWMTGERKFQDPNPFKSFAKLLFGTNKIPPIKDPTDMAYFRRWLIVQCDNVVDKKDVDPMLFEKLTTKEELSGMLNWSLEGLDRLIKNGKFSHSDNPEETKATMMRSGAPLTAFVQDVLVEDPENKITKDQMYEIYSIYAKEKKLPRLSKEQLGRQLERHCEYIIAKTGKVRAWMGATLNPTLRLEELAIEKIKRIIHPVETV